MYSSFKQLFRLFIICVLFLNSNLFSSTPPFFKSKTVQVELEGEEIASLERLTKSGIIGSARGKSLDQVKNVYKEGEEGLLLFKQDLALVSKKLLISLSPEDSQKLQQIKESLDKGQGKSSLTKPKMWKRVLKIIGKVLVALGLTAAFVVTTILPGKIITWPLLGILAAYIFSSQFASVSWITDLIESRSKFKKMAA